MSVCCDCLPWGTLSHQHEEENKLSQHILLSYFNLTLWTDQTLCAPSNFVLNHPETTTRCHTRCSPTTITSTTSKGRRTYLHPHQKRKEGESELKFNENLDNTQPQREPIREEDWRGGGWFTWDRLAVAALVVVGSLAGRHGLRGALERAVVALLALLRHRCNSSAKDPLASASVAFTVASTGCALPESRFGTKMTKPRVGWEGLGSWRQGSGGARVVSWNLQRM
jgi:hypothetical protein